MQIQYKQKYFQEIQIYFTKAPITKVFGLTHTISTHKLRENGMKKQD